MPDKKALLKKVSIITDLVPLGQWQATPWDLFYELKKYFADHLYFLWDDYIKSKKTEDSFLALKNFNEVFYIKRILEDLILEGYVEGTAWLLDDLPRLKKIRSIMDLLEKISRPKENKPVAVFRGENWLVYYQEKYFLKSWLTKKIYELEKNDIFALFPKHKRMIKDKKLFSILDVAFGKILKSRKNNHEAKMYKFLDKFGSKSNNFDVVADFFYFDGSTTVQKYHQLVEKWIKKNIKKQQISNIGELNVVINKELNFIRKKAGKKSVALIEDYMSDFENNIERNFLALDNMSKYNSWIDESIDNKNCRKVYILRDTISIYELELMKNILNKEESGSKIILVNRDMLARQKRRGYWWEITSAFLYNALNKKVKSFDELFNSYYNDFESLIKKNDDFKELVIKLGEYLIKDGVFKDNKKVVFIDTGVQGSIAILLSAVTKFLVNEGTINKHIEFDLRLYTVLFYFRMVYQGKYFSDNSSFIRDMEYTRRQDYLYQYIPRSFDKLGYPEIEISNRADQLLANIELLCSIILRQNL